MAVASARGERASWRATVQFRLWPSALLLSVPALVAMLLNHPTTYVGDNRFEQFWAPGWRIVRETMLWDGTRGMGRVGEEFWPVTIPMGFLRALGLSPAVTEHVWHGLLLMLAGLGVLCLVRIFQPRIGLAHVIAALVYMCNPFSVTFLVPSNLYWNYLLAPWLLFAGLRGAQSTSSVDRWRWAAVWAVLIYSAGDTDLPGVFFAALWLAPVLLFAVVVERWVTWRQVGRWLSRAAVLTAVVSAPMMVKVVLGAGALGQRLLYTETPLQVNGTSSWTESFRGLGYWVSYFRTPGVSPDIPGGVGWYQSAGGVLSTFVLPVLALVALWRLRWRARLLFMAIAIPSLVIMVGSFRPSQPPPAGRLLLAAYRVVPSLSSLRNTYKAGSGLMIAVAVLVGVGASALGTFVKRRGDPWMRPLGTVALVGVIGLSSVPLWNGGLYPPDKEMRAIPSYWTQAASWIESQPGDARVLVLPGSTQTAYRWGWAGDDILDSLFRRHPNVVPTNFPVSGTVTANIIDALENRLDEDTLTAQMLVPIAQQLNVGWVLIRNDLDWTRINEPRPAELAQLRGTSVLPLEKTFGRRGENTTARSDRSDEATEERNLPPIEIYRVPGLAHGQQLARSASPPIIVDGDGGALPSLAAQGDLADGRTVEFAGDTSDDKVATAIDQGADLVVTDTNRRRLTIIRGPGPTSSETLSAGQNLTQPPQDLFGRPGTQTVAYFPDASSISASGSGSDLVGFNSSLRAANAFDGLTTTAWRDGGFEDPVGSWIKVEFRKPETLSQVKLSPWLGVGKARAVSEASLEFDNGSSVKVRFPAGRTSVSARFAARTTRSLTIRIDAVRGVGDGAVGFTEIAIPGVNLTEYIATPTHLFTSTDPALRQAVAHGHVTYLFRRSIEFADSNEELRIRRRFTTAGSRHWQVTARLSPSDPPLDQVVDQLVGGSVGAYGSSRLGSPSTSRGGLAVDDSPETAWAGQPVAGQSLTIHFPTHSIDHVQISVLSGPNDYPAGALDVQIGGGKAHTVTMVGGQRCGTEPCEKGTLDVPAVDAAHIKITLDDGDGGGRPIRISNVAIVGPDGFVNPAAAPADGTCARGLVDVDGKPVGLRSATPVLAALDAGTATLVSCTPVPLGPGTHRLTTSAGARVDEVQLDSEPTRSLPASQPPITATVTQRSPTAIDLAIRAPHAGVITTGQSYDPAWVATADGHDLGRPFELEGQSAWVVPAGTTHVHLTFGPQRWYSVALAMAGVGLALCGWLIFRGRGGGRRRRPRRPPVYRRRVSPEPASP